ncbi:MAG: hypothetical protein ABI666_00315 [Ferruginibacter sp.]
MSDEEKLPEEQPENKELPDENILPTGQAGSFDESTTEVEQRETNNEKQETNNMETHAHHLHKAPGHGWKHYFFEFFMLFLAVTLGFFVENMREHYVERAREKEYIHSLIQDLKADTGFLKNAIAIHDQSNKMIDTLIKVLKNKDTGEAVKHAYFLARTIPFLDQSLLINDKTFEQMKSSGSLRLINDPAILDSISYYYGNYKWVSEGPVVMEIKNRQELFLTLEKLFDMGVFQEMLHSPSPFTPEYPKSTSALLSKDDQVINSVCARYHFMYGTKKVLINSAEGLYSTASRLIILLQSKYNLNNE